MGGWETCVVVAFYRKAGNMFDGNFRSHVPAIGSPQVSAQQPTQRTIQKPIRQPIQKPIQKPIQLHVQRPSQQPTFQPFSSSLLTDQTSKWPIQKPIHLSQSNNNNKDVSSNFKQIFKNELKHNNFESEIEFGTTVQNGVKDGWKTCVVVRSYKKTGNMMSFNDG